MLDEQTRTTDEQQPDTGDEQASRATGETPPDQAKERSDGAASREPVSDWPDLDAYQAQLREEHEDWAERLRAVQTQLATVRPMVAQITAQYDALGVEQDIGRLCEAVLGGAGMIQRVRFDFDLERYLTLVWPVKADPRPALAEAQGAGEYRVDVWFGIGADGRPRVRVEGAKRLEAPLPTSRERLRRVLLAAVQSPRHVLAAASPEAGGEPPDPNAPEPADSPLEEDEGQPVESARPRPGDADEQPPPEEQVIPLGPAHEAENADR